MMGTSILANDISTVLKINKTKDGFNLIRENINHPMKVKVFHLKLDQLFTHMKMNPLKLFM